MITWTFDLLALLVGYVIGVICGMVVYLFIEMRDGGSWSRGFSAGFDTQKMIRKIWEAANPGKEYKE